jgi:hypothetical protein
MLHNPSLRQEARYEPATVIPLKQESSLLDWLVANNRLVARESQDNDLNLEDDEEISELMDVDDDNYLDEEDLEQIED